jgi:hypothetical protein
VGDTERGKADAWWAALSEERRAQLRTLGQDHLPRWAVAELLDAGIELTADPYWPAAPGEPPVFPIPGVLRDVIRAER